jgi:hypothetical protein
MNEIAKWQILQKYQISYTTPSTVNEVSAIFVETINRRQLGGGGLNTRTCRVITNPKIVSLDIILLNPTPWIDTSPNQKIQSYSYASMELLIRHVKTGSG